ncbi:hypothetical protein BHYA_0307g00010 [Botrytis hyacinthi]|uniref:Uncharacterized protein n=1 Tax=Botrytis hyacinthi TaxID=278943 RepID=A0A4Z1G960_9HELO|nr:hypothetical protein BHYA_0307g00010 [Botrytis hyacinthi]
MKSEKSQGTVEPRFEGNGSGGKGKIRREEIFGKVERVVGLLKMFFFAYRYRILSEDEDTTHGDIEQEI